MNLSQGRTELRSRGFTDLTDARANFFLNAAKNTFEDVYPWPWLETTTTGTSPLTISDLKAVLFVSDTTNRTQLWGLERSDILATDPALGATGSPSYWFLSGTDTLTAWPTGSSSLSVLYVKFSAELSADSDTPLIPSRYHDTWIDLACVEAYRDNDELDTANLLFQTAQARIQGYVAVYAGRNMANPGQTRVYSRSEDW